MTKPDALSSRISRTFARDASQRIPQPAVLRGACVGVAGWSMPAGAAAPFLPPGDCGDCSGGFDRTSPIRPELKIAPSPDVPCTKDESPGTRSALSTRRSGVRCEGAERPTTPGGEAARAIPTTRPLNLRRYHRSETPGGVAPPGVSLAARAAIQPTDVVRGFRALRSPNGTSPNRGETLSCRNRWVSR